MEPSTKRIKTSEDICVPSENPFLWLPKNAFDHLLSFLGIKRPDLSRLQLFVAWKAVRLHFFDEFLNRIIMHQIDMTFPLEQNEISIFSRNWPTIITSSPEFRESASERTPSTLAFISGAKEYTLPEIPNHVRLLNLLDFNCKKHGLKKLPSELKKLALSSSTEEPLPRFPDGMEYFHAGSSYKGPIEYLPASMKMVSLQGENVRELPDLPPRLEILSLGFEYAHPFSQLPRTLVELELSLKGDHVLPKLPDTLKKLSLEHYKHPLEVLPPALRCLTLFECSCPCPELPSTLKLLFLITTPHQLRSFPPKLKYLSLFESTPQFPELPASLRSLKLRHTESITFPETSPLLPQNLKRLVLLIPLTLLPEIPQSLNKLKLCEVFSLPSRNVPSSLHKHLKTLHIASEDEEDAMLEFWNIRATDFGPDGSFPAACETTLETFIYGIHKWKHNRAAQRWEPEEEHDM